MARQRRHSHHSKFAQSSASSYSLLFFWNKVFLQSTERAVMASGRNSATLLCVCSLLVLLLAADVAVAQTDLPEPAKAPFTGSRKHLRGSWIKTAKESLESFARRELSDYGSNSSGSNCSGNCKK